MEFIAPLVLVFAFPLLFLWGPDSYYSSFIVFLLGLLYGYLQHKFNVRNKFTLNRFRVSIIVGLIFGIGWFLWLLPDALESNANYIPSVGSGMVPSSFTFFSPLTDLILVSIGFIIHISIQTILGSYIGTFIYSIFKKKQ